MPAAALRFYFDFSCPYAYIASTVVEGVAERSGVSLELRPILLGGVFRALDTPQNLSEKLSPAKARHNLADIHRQAAVAEIPLRMHPGHPVRTVEALRALLVVGEPFMPLARAFYRAYWVENRDLSQRAVVREILCETGHAERADEIMGEIDSSAIKAQLRERTEEAVQAGVFGIPTAVIDTGSGPQLYWGVDRLGMVERALRSAPLRFPVDLYFDYSSPFAYLGCYAAERALGDHLRWRPMLLGAVFKKVGTSNIPFFEQVPAKRAHTSADLRRQAAELGAPYSFPSHFPMRTVLALRVTLAAGGLESAEGRRLLHGLFRALWVEDRDIADPAVVSRLCDELGLDGGALVEAAGSEAIKAALFESTEQALEAGVFGAPTFVVHTDQGPKLFWGCDRLDLVVRAAAGDSRVYP